MEEASPEKIEQLTQSLEQSQAKITEKRATIQALIKSTLPLEDEVQILRAKALNLQREQHKRKEILNKKKEGLKQQIETIKKLLNMDKNTLELLTKETQFKLSNLESIVQDTLKKRNELIGDNLEGYPVQELASLSLEEQKTEEEKLEEEGINVTTDRSGFLTVDTVTQIIKASTARSEGRFSEIVQKSREKLRANKDLNLETYLAEAESDISQHSKLIEEAEDQILSELKIPRSLMDKSLERYIASRNREVVALMNVVTYRLKSSIHSTKKIDNETLKEILKFKNDYIENEAKNVFTAENMKMLVESHLANSSGPYSMREEISLNLLTNFFKIKLNNLVFDKFSVEEEDIREACISSGSQHDVEVASLVHIGENILAQQISKLELTGDILKRDSAWDL